MNPFAYSVFLYSLAAIVDVPSSIHPSVAVR
jgi:hypothetical protein